MEHRDAQVTIIMGRNGTGKSTFAEKIIKSMKQRAVVVTLNGAPKIWRSHKVIDPADPKEWKFKKGIRQVWYMQHEKDTMKHIYKNYHDGLLIFDDCRGYLSSNVDADMYLKRLLMDFRHKMLDLFFICHAPTDVPARLWGFYSTAFIGATDALFPKSRIATDSAEKIIQAQKTVNASFKKAKLKNDGSHYGIFLMVMP
jgi:molybdopterin-guanine dinucleotide biosynthesis protein